MVNFIKIFLFVKQLNKKLFLTVQLSVNSPTEMSNKYLVSTAVLRLGSTTGGCLLTIEIMGFGNLELERLLWFCGRETESINRDESTTAGRWLLRGRIHCPHHLNRNRTVAIDRTQTQFVNQLVNILKSNERYHVSFLHWLIRQHLKQSPTLQLLPLFYIPYRPITSHYLSNLTKWPSHQIAATLSVKSFRETLAKSTAHVRKHSFCLLIPCLEATLMRGQKFCCLVVLVYFI